MKKLLIVLACVAVPASLCAEQWQILGTRPMGMGGAFVAVAQGPIAQYWNPAGLVKSSANVSGMELPVGVNAEFTGNIIKNASQIGDMASSFQSLQADQNGTGTDRKVNAQQIASFAKTLSLMGDMNDPGKGVLIEVAGGVNFKFSKVALSVNNFTSIGLNPYIDVTNIGLGANAGAGLQGVRASGNTGSLAGTYASGAYSVEYNAAFTAIDGAITTIGYANLANALCGGANCNGETQTQFAYALMNQALIDDSMSIEQLTQAANTLKEYAPTLKTILANPGVSAANPYANNNSNLTVAGASFMEVAAGYAWNVDKWMRGLSLGANLKLINGRTTVTTFKFLSESKTADAFKLSDMKSTWKPAVDLGLLWDVNRTYPRFPLRPKVGFVMRNINSPSFKTSGAKNYDLDRQVRMGLAINPAKFWTLAMDMDLTKNKTPVKGFDSRELSAGTEINIVNRKAFNIPLRGGIIKNMAEKDSKMAYTLGTGLNLLFMHFDVSGVVSSQKTELEGKKIPSKVGVAASFGLLF